MDTDRLWERIRALEVEYGFDVPGAHHKRMLAAYKANDLDAILLYNAQYAEVDALRRQLDRH